MVRHTQTVRLQIADELFECVLPFCEIGAERVKIFAVSRKCTSILISEHRFAKKELDNSAFSQKSVRNCFHE